MLFDKIVVEVLFNKLLLNKRFAFDKTQNSIRKFP